MVAAQRIALFGGTFDPVHHGHLEMARCAKQALQLARVVFIPCRISPHKTGSHPASSADRLKMLELATEGLAWASIDDLETRQDGPSYSWKTAEAVHQRHPDAKLFWIMGNDQWQALPRWEQPARLAQLVEFIVLCRGGFPDPQPGFTMHPVRFEHPANSTTIRQAIARGESPRWLDTKVAGWIRQHGLYQEKA